MIASYKLMLYYSYSSRELKINLIHVFDNINYHIPGVSLEPHRF